MNPDSTRKRRNLTLVAAGVALLVLTGWLVTAWGPQGHAANRTLTSGATGTTESGDATDASTPAKSRPRETRGNGEQIRRRVESLLTIKPNEIAIITVPKATLDHCFGEPGNPPMPDSVLVPLLTTIVAKAALKVCLEDVLRDAGPVKVMVGDDSATTYTGNGIEVRVKVIEKTDRVSKVQVETEGNGSKSQTELSVYPGNSLVFRFPAPSEVGVVILIGDDPGPATGTTNP